MRLISWNVDGLDQELLPMRHLNMVTTIAPFDVIFMQEVVGETWDIVKTQMPDHEHFIGKTIDEYFVTVSLDRAKFTADKVEYISFEKFNCSAMGTLDTLLSSIFIYKNRSWGIGGGGDRSGDNG